MQALAADPDSAGATGRDPTPPPPPTLAEWSPERGTLTDIYDRLGELIAVTVGAAGGTPPFIQPAPRPVTAIEEKQRSDQRREYDELVALVKSLPTHD